MITYNPAFDLYHSIYRIAHIVGKLEEGEWMEADKVRIWDFFMLFPDKVYNITIRREEEDLRQYRSKFLKRENNPYEFDGDNRQLFEWMKPVQLSALGSLVSWGILDREQYEVGRVRVANNELLHRYLEQVGDVSPREHNVLAFMSSLSRTMPMTGEYGLKARTKLMESKYDAE